MPKKLSDIYASSITSCSNETKYPPYTHTHVCARFFNLTVNFPNKAKKNKYFRKQLTKIAFLKIIKNVRVTVKIFKKQFVFQATIIITIQNRLCVNCLI